MKQEMVAIPIYQDRISPLLDVARKFAVYEIADGEIKQKITLDINSESESSKVEKLSELGISVIISSAVSYFVSQIISEKGIRLISWVSGPVDEVVNAYIKNELIASFSQNLSCRRGRRKRHCANNYKQTLQKRSNNMKIAITSEGRDLKSMVDPRFGRAQGFILFEPVNGKIEYFDNNQNLQPAQGAGIQAAKAIINAGVQVLITGNVGPKAYSALNSAGIEIYTNVQGSVQDVIDNYRKGKLKKASEANVEGHW